MKALKDYIDRSFIEELSENFASLKLPFDKDNFVTLIFTSDWKSKEMKQRIRIVSEAVYEIFDRDYLKILSLLVELVKYLQYNKINGSIGYWFIPDFIENFGINYPEESLSAMEIVTPFVSCEFAIRPFIEIQQNFVFEKISTWSKSENVHLRRFSSEGCRPRLPWGIALKNLKKNPKPIIPILENLITDESEYVRKSVSNNLNDISKDNPSIVIDFIKKWKNSSKEIDRLLKHSARTLLKNGNNEILDIFKVSFDNSLEIKNLELFSDNVKIGDNLQFQFILSNSSKKIIKLRIEYFIHLLRSNGSYTKKIFKLSEREINPETEILIEKKHSFKIVTTRKYYSGTQRISIVVNGNEFPSLAFELI